MAGLHLGKEGGAGACIKNPALTTFSPAASHCWIPNIPGGLNLISCLQERSGDLQEVRLQGEVQREESDPGWNHPDTCNLTGLPQGPPSWRGLNPALMTACGDREAAEHPASAFP